MRGRPANRILPPLFDTHCNLGIYLNGRFLHCNIADAPMAIASCKLASAEDPKSDEVTNCAMQHYCTIFGAERVADSC